jgi:Protein of unknown function (DUF3106)
MNSRFLFPLLLGAVLLLPEGATAATVPAPGGVPRGGAGIVRADRTRTAQAGEVTPEKIERWRKMSPEQQERIRKRYQRWKSLSPGQRERILNRRRVWRSLPEADRRYLGDRREVYRHLGPEDKQAVGKFVRQMRQLPVGRRHLLRRRIWELRNLPASRRDEQLMGLPPYRRLSPTERHAVNRFLFSERPGRAPGVSRERPHE